MRRFDELGRTFFFVWTISVGRLVCNRLFECGQNLVCIARFINTRSYFIFVVLFKYTLEKIYLKHVHGICFLVVFFENISVEWALTRRISIFFICKSEFHFADYFWHRHEGSNPWAK